MSNGIRLHQFVRTPIAIAQLTPSCLEGWGQAVYETKRYLNEATRDASKDPKVEAVTPLEASNTHSSIALRHVESKVIAK